MNQLTKPESDLLAEANHRVANSLALLGGLVRMQARAVGKEAIAYSNAEVRLLLDGVAARIATIGQLHRLLAHMPTQGAVPINSHLRDVCAALIAAFSSEQQRVLIEYQGQDCLLLIKYVQPITLMVCEILTNAIKYAHPAGVPVRMIVSCNYMADGALQVRVSDDGIGLPEGFDPAKDGGVGFQIIRALAAEIEADLAVASDNLGVTVTITTPAALVANAKTA